MGLKKSFKKLCFVLLIPLGIILVYLSTLSLALVERVYSSGIYRIIAAPLNLISGLFPFSLAEILLIGLIVLVISKFIHLIIKLFKTPRQAKQLFLDSLINIVAFISILYFSFVVIWGLNYQRVPFSQIAGLDIQPASVEELASVCKRLATQANELRKYVSEDENGVMTLPAGKQDALKRAYKGYENAAKAYPEFKGIYARPKGVLLSEVMSYLGIEGIYSPFTGEANVNTSILDAPFPFTACHEMAHQRGFSREDEANYISYIACRYHPDKDFQYSGMLYALIYTSNALYENDATSYSELRSNYSEGIIRDLNAINQYWRKYETPVQDFSSSVNDTYLKANRQEDGVKSYGRMVDLLIAEYRKSANQ
ncbi:DUF3810 domain-containing protein [Acetivibrio cellulolyticus]|uniref:DUF3810 domain-containing protein n=1 Tax=Acetivibrio cellulolyticus TaxID=35830 RepID=UPI0001E2CCCD|nr:DUF3810 domain-containing protein [Acetivibrio cellulolyticus]